MTIQEAIEKATEGGYKYPSVCENRSCCETEAILQPIFWQSLGKAMGWGVSEEEDIVYYWMSVDDDERISKKWRNEMHHFIDHIANGETSESFFQQL